MSLIHLRARAPRAAAIVLSSLTACAAAAAPPLHLTDALELALVHAPSIAAGEAGLAGARALVTPSDALPDPKLLLGLNNVPVEGPGNFALNRDFMTMEQIGVMQEVPNRAKRRARRSRATAAVDVAAAEARALRLRVIRDTAIAWIDVHFAERRLAGLDALDGENALLGDAVTALIASGRAGAADAVVPKTEAVRLAERRDVLVQEIAAARARLRRYVGEDADRPLAGAAPEFMLDHALVATHVERHPELAVAAARSREAQAGVSEAAADKRPDWDVALAFQHREVGADMVTVEVSIGLPIFGTSRQDPRIVAQQNEVRRLDAETEALLRMHAAELESQLAEHARLERSLARYENELLPLAGQRASLALAAYRAGTGDLQALIAAREALVEARLEAIAIEGAARQLGAAIHFAYQETLP